MEQELSLKEQKRRERISAAMKQKSESGGNVGRQWHITEQEAAELENKILELYRSNQYPVTEIAEICQVGRNKIYAVLKKNNLK